MNNYYRNNRNALKMPGFEVDKTQNRQGYCLNTIYCFSIVLTRSIVLGELSGGVSIVLFSSVISTRSDLNFFFKNVKMQMKGREE